MQISDPQALNFWNQFIRDRKVNSEFYKRVPGDKFDFRMVDKPGRRSDSPRESLIHQIDTTRDYINGVRSGLLQFGVEYGDLQKRKSKSKLLGLLKRTESELFELLASSDIGDKKTRAPWTIGPALSTISVLWGLDAHEILHQGWNLALMDHLGIGRFPELVKMWGK